MEDRVHPGGTLAARSWALLALAATAGFLLLVAAFNAVVDPTAQLGTGVLEPVAAGSRDREVKLDLLDAGATPPLVTLGSSRSKKLDPAWLGADEGVNAAVVGGDLFEARVFAAWLAERAERRGEAFPQLVVGVDVEQFRDSSLQGSGFLAIPTVADVARREASGSDGSIAGELDRAERLLLTLQVTKASLASVRARVRGGAPATSRADDAQDSGSFTERGVPSSDRAWFTARAAQLAARTPARIERNIDEYRATYASIGAELDADAEADLRALVAIAREAGGPPPLLYLTPSHPRFIAAFEPHDGRQANALALLREVAKRGRARVVDCVACIGAADDRWIDAVHPSPIGMRELADRLRTELGR